MPRDRPRTAHSQAETNEESQNEFRMSELLNTLLNRQPRIALGIRAAGGPQFGELFRRIGAKRCRRRHAHKRDESDGADRAQRSSEVATRVKGKRRHYILRADRNFPS